MEYGGNLSGLQVFYWVIVLEKFFIYGVVINKSGAYENGIQYIQLK